MRLSPWMRRFATEVRTPLGPTRLRDPGGDEHKSDHPNWSKEAHAQPLRRAAKGQTTEAKRQRQALAIAGDTVIKIPAREADVSRPRRNEQDMDELSRRVWRRMGMTLICMTVREQRRRIIDELAADVQGNSLRPCETQAISLLAIGFLSTPGRSACRHERDS